MLEGGRAKKMREDKGRRGTGVEEAMKDTRDWVPGRGSGEAGESVRQAGRWSVLREEGTGSWLQSGGAHPHS
ncbi:hypothetical protein Pmani_023453 [Petrolisthes manimaculis]|uniref:Uncharacterized protein n=1 Tax=Petrolisthes manimaculis TaxID=1843537 RepID=A0AAE1PBQ5_9EUCA|nr:hypothetical protein Pmani_023453 [Petrolisthes manimaculis]